MQPTTLTPFPPTNPGPHTRRHPPSINTLIATCQKNAHVYPCNPHAVADINRTSKRLHSAITAALHTNAVLNAKP